jgi:nucleoside-diphosphate-sugar epimerase
LSNRYQGVRAAVLGASGFIGQWVARKLCDAGASVYWVVRDADALRRGEARGSVMEADLSNGAAVADLYARIRPAITFNLAGYGVDPSERDESTAWRINAELPCLLCECAARWKNDSWRGQHLVHAGSAAEYGTVGGDLREDGPAQPSTLYGKSKLKGTEAVTKQSVALGLRGVTARLFTVYGPGEHAGRLLPSLMQAARTGRPLDLSAGLQRRDFTYIEDVAEGLLRLGLAAGGSPIVNLATGRLTTVRGFAETAAGILGISDSRLHFGAVPASSHEMDHGPVSLARLRSQVGWVPPTAIPAGITKAWKSAWPGTPVPERCA